MGCSPALLSPFSFQIHRREDQTLNTYRAAAPVATGVPGAFVDMHFTAGPGEAGPAGTGVAALAGVATSSSVHAGLVVSAVVEIWRERHSGTCGSFSHSTRHMAAQQQQKKNVFLSSGTLDSFFSSSSTCFCGCFCFLPFCSRCSVVSLPRRRYGGASSRSSPVSCPFTDFYKMTDLVPIVKAWTLCPLSVP